MNDYHVHIAADGEHEFSAARISLFLEQARYMGLQEMGISEHHEVLEQIDWTELDAVRPGSLPQLKTALEIGYEPYLVEDIKGMISGRTYDYIIGSLHFIDGWAFDHPDFRHLYEERNVDEVYRRYYQLMEMLVECGLFDFIGHLDVVKKWGHRPSRSSEHRGMLDRLLAKIRLKGMAVEINSAGLRKPVGELYPSPGIIAMMYDAGIPVCFGSDAHNPEEVGQGLDIAARAARQAGYRKMVRFEKRQQFLVDLK